MPRPVQGEFAQPAEFGVPLGYVERGQVRGDEPQVERTVPGEFGGPADRTGVGGEQVRHLRAGTQVGAPGREEPARGFVETLPVVDGGQRCRQSPAVRRGVVGRGAGDARKTSAIGEFREQRVAFTVLGEAVVRELDRDPVGAEALDEVAQGRLGRLGAPTSRARRTCRGGSR